MLLPRLKNNGNITLWLNPLQLKIRKQVEDKIRAGTYQFEHQQICVICKGSHFRLIGERDRYGLYYPVCICQGCGLVFVNPRLNQASFNQFYNEEYRKLYLGTEQPTAAFFREQYIQGEHIYSFLQQNSALTDKTKTILEIGCGAGGILQFFKEKGYTVEGIDLGEAYIMYGKQHHSLQLHATNLSDFTVLAKPDLIIYSHVLEHLLDLEKELALIRRICKPETKVYIEVPSLKQMHVGYDLNLLKYFHIAHTYHFTLTTLANLFQANGFELVTGTEYVRAIFQQTDLVSQPIVSDYTHALNYIRKYERRRWLFYLTPRAAKYYTGMILIKFLDRLGLKERVKNLLKK